MDGDGGGVCSGSWHGGHHTQVERVPSLAARPLRTAPAYVRRQGGLIWTQRADSCACPSMPDSLREGGYSSHSGDPRELAETLVNHLAEQCS